MDGVFTREFLRYLAERGEIVNETYFMREWEWFGDHGRKRSRTNQKPIRSCRPPSSELAAMNLEQMIQERAMMKRELVQLKRYTGNRGRDNVRSIEILLQN